MSVHQLHAWYHGRPEERFWTIKACEIPWECWELNPGPLEEEPGLLTADPSLQLCYMFLEDR